MHRCLSSMAPRTASCRPNPSLSGCPPWPRTPVWSRPSADRTPSREPVLMSSTTPSKPSPANSSGKDLSMSHHLDTPLAAQNGQLYIDDLYVFDSNDATVFVMDVNSSITGVYAQPGFHPEARYEIKVHFDGADFEDLTYRVSFGDADASGQQALRLHALTGADAREDSAAGELVLEGRSGEAASGGARIWAGRIADAFYIDLSLLA